MAIDPSKQGRVQGSFKPQQPPDKKIGKWKALGRAVKRLVKSPFKLSQKIYSAMKGKPKEMSERKVTQETKSDLSRVRDYLGEEFDEPSQISKPSSEIISEYLNDD